jgi:flagellin-like hook-associated protein FlgL
LIRLEVISGTVSGTAMVSGTPMTTAGPFTAGEVFFDRGVDAQVRFDGQVFTGIGRAFNITTPSANVQFKLDPELVPFTIPTTVSVSAANTGLHFQLSDRPVPSDRIFVGLDAVQSSILGEDTHRDSISEAMSNGLGPSLVSTPIEMGGFLNSIKTGGANSLLNRPENASVIVEAALKRVNTMRGFLGAVTANHLEPNLESVRVHMQELTESLSSIRDLDFAEESSEFVRTQIVFQSNIGVLSAANAIPQAVLTLLGF